MVAQTPIGSGQGPSPITIWGQNPDGVATRLQCDADGNLITVAGDPIVLTALADGSGNVANAAAVSTLSPSSGKKAYISGFQATGTGATGALGVDITVTGVVGGPLTYGFLFPAGATVPAQPLSIAFNPPLAATAVDTDIVVSLAASGTGGLHAATNAQGVER